jgi:excisionase family DNA binding protein
MKNERIEKMLTSSQLAAELGLTKSTVLRLARDGLIPCIKLPTQRGDYRFDLNEVRAVMVAEAGKIVSQ